MNLYSLEGDIEDKQRKQCVMTEGQMELLRVERQRPQTELRKAFPGRQPSGQVTSFQYDCCTRDYGHLCEAMRLLGYVVYRHCLCQLGLWSQVTEPPATNVSKGDLL